jgi:hypothetical protein
MYEIERCNRGILYSIHYIIIVSVQINCHDLDFLSLTPCKPQLLLEILLNEMFHFMSKALKHRSFYSVAVTEICFGIGVNRVA